MKEPYTIVYKDKDPSKGGGDCNECGRHCSNPIFIGYIDEFGQVLEGLYGSCCAKKYKVGGKLIFPEN